MFKNVLLTGYTIKKVVERFLLLCSKDITFKTVILYSYLSICFRRLIKGEGVKHFSLNHGHLTNIYYVLT